MKRSAVKQHRKTRVASNEPGHAHELTFSCFQRLPLLSKDRTRTWFVEALDRTRKRYRLELWAYVIMPEHVHLLLWPTKDPHSMSAILKSMKQPVARAAIRFLRAKNSKWSGPGESNTGSGRRVADMIGISSMSTWPGRVSSTYTRTRFGAGWWSSRLTGLGRVPGAMPERMMSYWRRTDVQAGHRWLVEAAGCGGDRTHGQAELVRGTRRIAI